MVDQRFVKFKGPLSLKELENLSGAKLLRGSPEFLVEGVASLEEASSRDLSLFQHPKYQKAFSQTQAGVVVLPPHAADLAPATTALFISSTPLKAFSLMLKALYEEDAPQFTVHPQATVDPSAQLGEGCRIGPYAVIEAGAVLGPNCWIGPHTLVGTCVVVGEGSRIGSHVTLTHALLGKNVTVKPGARIGQQGFGFFMEETGLHVTQLQLGRVLIGDHVEIGANTTIDRGSLKDTVIEDFARIDNLVQIAHNVHVGRGVVLVAQVGIAGSTTIGDRSVLGGQVGVAGHLALGSGVRVAAKSGVMHNLTDAEVFGGIPAVPIQEWRRQSVLLRKMGQKKSPLPQETKGEEK